MPGAYAACRLGSSGRTRRASACPMRTSLRTEGLAASSMRCPGEGLNQENHTGRCQNHVFIFSGIPKIYTHPLSKYKRYLK